MLRKRTLALLFVAGLLALALAGCGGSAEPTQAPAATEPPAAQPTAAPPTATLEPTPEPTQEPALVVEDVSTFVDSANFYYVVGLITNYYDQTASGIEIGLKGIDPDGNEVFTDTTWLLTDNIRPGDSAPFIWWTSDEVPDGIEWEIDVVSKDLQADFADGELDIINDTINWTDDYIYITGEVINQSEEPTKLDSLAAAAIDAEGRILTASYVDVAAYYYAPGDSAPFRITLDASPDLVEQIADYVVYVDAVLASPEEAYSYDFGEDEYIYLDKYDDMHLVGEVTNLNDVPLNLRLVAGLYDENGVVLDADYLDLAIDSLASQQTGSYDFDGWSVIRALPDLVDQVAYYSVQVDPYWTFKDEESYLDIQVENVVTNAENGLWEIEATLVNNSGQDADDVLVLMELRDAATGQLLAFDYSYLFESLGNGAQAAFDDRLYYNPNLDSTTLEFSIKALGTLP